MKLKEIIDELHKIDADLSTTLDPDAALIDYRLLSLRILNGWFPGRAEPETPISR